MPDRPESPLRPTNRTIIAGNAIREFVDWLYEEGPDPASMSREKLIDRYWSRVATEALQSAAIAAQERMTTDTSSFDPKPIRPRIVPLRKPTTT